MRIIEVKGNSFEDLLNAIEYDEGCRISRRNPKPKIVVEVVADKPRSAENTNFSLFKLAFALVGMVK